MKPFVQVYLDDDLDDHNHQAAAAGDDDNVQEAEEFDSEWVDGSVMMTHHDAGKPVWQHAPPRVLLTISCTAQWGRMWFRCGPRLLVPGVVGPDEQRPAVRKHSRKLYSPSSASPPCGTSALPAWG